MLRQPKELKKVFRERQKDDKKKTPAFAEVLTAWKKLPADSPEYWVLLICMVGQLRIKEVLKIRYIDIDINKGIVKIKKRSGEIDIINIGHFNNDLKGFLDNAGVRNLDRAFYSEYKNVESAYRMFRYRINNKHNLTEQEKKLLLNVEVLKFALLITLFKGVFDILFTNNARCQT